MFWYICQLGDRDAYGISRQITRLSVVYPSGLQNQDIKTGPYKFTQTARSLSLVLNFGEQGEKRRRVWWESVLRLLFLYALSSFCFRSLRAPIQLKVFFSYTNPHLTNCLNPCNYVEHIPERRFLVGIFGCSCVVT